MDQPQRQDSGLPFRVGDRVLDTTDGSKGEVVGHQVYDGFGGWWWIVRFDGTEREVEVRGQHLKLLDGDPGIDFGVIDVPLVDTESFPRYVRFLPFVEDHFGTGPRYHHFDGNNGVPAVFGIVEAAVSVILVNPCRHCRTDEACHCAAAGVHCECTCGRCRFPGRLPDDGPSGEPTSDARAAANGMGC